MSRKLLVAVLALLVLAPTAAAANPLTMVRRWKARLETREKLLERARRDHSASHALWKKQVEDGVPEEIRAVTYQKMKADEARVALRKKQVSEARENLRRWQKRLGWVIGPNSLHRVMPNLTRAQARSRARVLGEAMHKYRITTRRRAAMFIAQIAHESGELRYTREIWGPTAIQRTYAYRLGNRGPRDGYRYRGGGYIQLTGRVNYAGASRGTGLALLGKPELLNQPRYAAIVSAWWWRSHGLNGIADRGDFLGVTRTINGGTNGLASRQMYYRRARTVAKWLVPRRG